MRSLTVRTSIESLRKEARSWLNFLRVGDEAAHARFRAVVPHAPAQPGLRDVQLAVAREYGLPGWSALRDALADLALLRADRAELADEVLRSAWQGDAQAACRIVHRVPDLSVASIHLAAMCGDLDEVRRRLAREPGAARVRGGPHRWEPLQYLAYGRLVGAEVHAVAIARLLLDAGADAGVGHDDGWGNTYTLSNGVIGQGENRRPEHLHAEALVDLFVDRGAPAFDPQVLYDTSLNTDDPRWLERSWARSEPGRWRTDRMAGLPMLDYLLGNAVERDHRRRATWLLDHGADPDTLHGYSHAPVHTHALLYGRVSLADLLAARGATVRPLPGVAAFQAAALRGDLAEARRWAAQDPSCLTLPGPLTVAAQRDRDDAVELLLSLGVPVDVCPPDQKRALHWAAQCGSVRVARRLLAAGADVDRRGSGYRGTPLGFALHFGQSEMVELLAPLTRDVFGLAQGGRLERLAEVLREDPAAAHARDPSGDPLWFALPDDDGVAVDLVDLLLAFGADPRATNAAGESPARAARRRGLLDAAETLESRGGG